MSNLNSPPRRPSINPKVLALFGGAAALAAATMTEALRDTFLSVNNRVNGFEHHLRHRAKEVRWWKRKTNKVNHFPHRSGCGPQECARRQRQIAKGMLTASNGLVTGGLD